ncbi:helix-turn-helix domain-containing protein, partial [Rhodococcus hoagii]|nr:helix-turn-helix domain-containing protein [Prescottella equi]
MDDADDMDRILDAVGPRLRALRQQRGTTLSDLAADTGISVSTLSRLEAGRRKPNLE